MSKQRYAAPWLHSIQIAGAIKRATAHLSRKEAAKALGMTPYRFDDILGSTEPLTPQVACRLHQFGLDGLELLLAQTIHSYFCACKHDPNGDPRGKKAMETPDFAKEDEE
jgi:hypothetical protein